MSEHLKTGLDEQWDGDSSFQPPVFTSPDEVLPARQGTLDELEA